MPRKKAMPDALIRILKQRRVTDLNKARDICVKYGFTISTGWLSVNRKIWMSSDADEAGIFLDEDETFDADMATRIMLYKGMKVHEFSEKRHFSSSQIAKFIERTPEACAEFAEKCLVWKGKPILMQDYQMNMVDGWLNRKRTCYPMGRGSGKDFTLAIFHAWLLPCFPNTRTLLVCPASRQVKTFMNENLAIFMQTSSVLMDSVQRFVEEEFILTNGSTIFSYGATSFIKGKHNIDYIFINEAGEVAEHVYENVLMPMLGTARGGGHFGIIGVPAGQQGYFWKAFQDGSHDINDTEAKYYVINLPTSVNKYYNKIQLQENKDIMSEDAFLQEHEAQFLDIKNALFSQGVIDQMKEDYDTYFGVVDKKRYDYYLSVDWGRIHSYTVCTITSRNKKTKHKRVVYIKAFKKKFPDQIDWICEADAIYNFKRIVPEYMGMGIPPSEALKQRLGSRKVKYFIPTPAAWFDVFTLMRDAAVNGGYKIPAGELRLIRQLRLLQFEIRASKLTVRSEGKDDFAQSAGIVFSVLGKKGRAGVAGSI